MEAKNLSTKKNTKIHQFVNDIYPRDLFVLVCDDFKFLKEMIEPVDSDFNEEWMKDQAAFVFRYVMKYTGKYGVCAVFRKKEYMTIRNMSHEAVHVAACIHYDCGMAMGFKNGEDETFAYLTGWAADCFNQVRTNKFK